MKGCSTRDEDFIEHIYVTTMHNTMLFFTEKGRCYWLKVYAIPEGTRASKGRAIQNVIQIEPDDAVRAYINVRRLDDREYVTSNYIIMCTKAGIVKKSIPVLIGEADERYDGVIEQAAAANKSKVIYAEREFRCESCTERGDRQSFSLRRTRDDRTFDVELDLRGIYQSRNVVTASAAIDFLHEETPLTISRRAYLEGMRDAAAHTSLHGRWQKIGDAPLTVCDTGHNAHGIAYVARQLKATPCKRLFCVMGFVRDKDLAHILPLLPHEAHYIFTQAHSDRAMTAGELTAKAAIYGLRGEAVADVPAAVARARELAGAEDMIFIGGSTYVVGEAL